MRHLMLLKCPDRCLNTSHRSPPFLITQLQFHTCNHITNSCMCVWCNVVDCLYNPASLPVKTIALLPWKPRDQKIRLPRAGAYEVQYDCLCLSLFPDAISLQGKQELHRQKTLVQFTYLLKFVMLTYI